VTRKAKENARTAADLVGSPAGWHYRAGGTERVFWRVGIPDDQLHPDPASLDYAAVNGVAGQAGQSVLGGRCRRR
jgi:hypothetical protein